MAPSIYSYPYWRLKSNIRFYKGVFCLFGHPHILNLQVYFPSTRMQNRCTQNPFLNLPVSYFFPTLFKPISFFDKSFYQYHLCSRCFIYNPVSSGSSRNYKRFGIIKALPHSFASLHPYCFPFHHHPNLATPFGFYFHRIFDGIPMDIVKMLFMGRQMFECIMFVFSNTSG